MADAKFSANIAKLSNQNYQTWKFMVELLLTKDDLWLTVEDYPPEEMTDEWRSKDRKTQAMIGLLLEDNQLHLVRKLTTTKHSWTALQRSTKVDFVK